MAWMRMRMMSIKRRLKALEKIAGRQGGLTPEEMAERCRYIEEYLASDESCEPLTLSEINDYKKRLAETDCTETERQMIEMFLKYLCDDGEDADDE